MNLIAILDRFGDILDDVWVSDDDESDGTVTGYHQIRIPESLQVTDDGLQILPLVYNTAAEKVMESSEDMTWDEFKYSHPDTRIYYIDNVTNVFVRHYDHNDQQLFEDLLFTRLSDNEELEKFDLPRGSVTFQDLHGSPNGEIIVLIRNNTVKLYSSPDGNRIAQYEEIIHLETNFSAIWTVAGPQRGPLWRLFTSPGFNPENLQGYRLVNGSFVRPRPSHDHGYHGHDAPPGMIRQYCPEHGFHLVPQASHTPVPDFNQMTSTITRYMELLMLMSTFPSPGIPRPTF